MLPGLARSRGPLLAGALQARRKSTTKTDCGMISTSPIDCQREKLYSIADIV